MADYESNVYYYPEKHHLVVLGELDDPASSYDFNTIMVWKHEQTGRVYWAQDSGCSCPSPFEDFNGIADLTEITDETFADFQRAVEQHCVWSGDWNDGSAFSVDKVDLVRKASEALR